MASAMASAATRSVPPPYTIPVGPRIRPPRLLPGTKAANTDPKPDEPPPTAGDVWVQGKWRKPGSNAARDRREVQSIRVEKALRHATHGMNIYAYNHVRTNQVVYSLTRVMQNNKILSQLLYHGKQTVPSAVRRDLWRPYFSIHFPETPAGAEAGLKAFRRLRELSTQRQLSPPSELIIATEADVKKAKDKYTPADLRTKLKNQHLKNLPIKNQLLPKKLRAKKLMNQKASSVADAAYVLNFVNGERSPAEELEAIVEQRARKYENLSSRAARRLNRIHGKEAEQEALIEARQEHRVASEGLLGLTPHAARRIALEQRGAVSAPLKGMEQSVSDPQVISSQKEATNEYMQSTTSIKALLAGEERPSEFNAEKFRTRYIKTWQNENSEGAEQPSPEDVDTAVKHEQEKVETQIADYDKRAADAQATYTQGQQSRNDASRTVQILWADLRDATYAERWSGNVYHGELEQRAAIKHERILTHRRTDIDADGNSISGPIQKISVQGSSTPHVFGTNNQSGWYQTPEQLSETRQEWRENKMKEWQESKLEQSRAILNQIDALQQQKQELIRKKMEIQPEFDALSRATAKVKASRLAGQTGLTAEDEVVQNLTDAEKYDLRTSMEAINDSIASNDKELTQMEQGYPSLYERIALLVAWRQGQTAYTSLLQFEAEINSLHSAFENEDSAVSERLQQIDRTLAGIYSPLAKLETYESSLVSRVQDYRQKIAQLEEQISDLKAVQQTPEIGSILSETQKALQNQHSLLSSDRSRIWESRLNEMSNALRDIEEDPNYAGTGIIDVLRQRVYAERQGNSEQVESLDQDLKAREEDKLVEFLGLDSPQAKKANIKEYDEQMREKGMEMPAPKPEKKGIWGRVKGVFGR